MEIIYHDSSYTSYPVSLLYTCSNLLGDIQIQRKMQILHSLHEMLIPGLHYNSMRLKALGNLELAVPLQMHILRIR